MKSILTILFSILLIGLVNGQETKERKISDAFEELESGKLVLRFFDALTGVPINKGKVEIQNFGDTETDFDGRAYFTPEEDNQTLKIKFSHQKYITSEFEIEIMAGTIFFNRFSISPKMPIGSLRVVLDWSDSPKDLDAHLVKKGDYHISFRNMRVSADGVAKLDRDDTDGFGPETITANSVDPNGEYLFYVHDFSNQNNNSSSKLSDSKGSVKVYGKQNELLDVFKIPEDNSGTYWNVFKIVGDRIIPLNTITTRPE